MYTMCRFGAPGQGEGYLRKQKTNAKNEET